MKSDFWFWGFFGFSSWFNLIFSLEGWWGYGFRCEFSINWISFETKYLKSSNAILFFPWASVWLKVRPVGVDLCNPIIYGDSISLIPV